jgi:transcriptional regulator with XRE-family HTH domain
MKKLTPFGKEIMKLCIDHECGQKDIAAKIGISKQHLTRILNGDMLPFPETVRSILNFFKLPFKQKRRLYSLCVVNRRPVDNRSSLMRVTKK